MNELQIDWNQERPTALQAIDLWDNVKIEPVKTWTKSAETLKTKISETHTNGGLQFHKYKIIGNRHFTWFSSRNRLDEINFVSNVLNRPELADYRKNLEISVSVPEIKVSKYWTDIYDLPGQLARTLGQGGAYNNLDPELAWEISTSFVREELQNRFEEFIIYHLVIENANWFFDIAWDYSVMLFDKRNNELLFIDITDTD